MDIQPAEISAILKKKVKLVNFHIDPLYTKLLRLVIIHKLGLILLLDQELR